MLWLPSVLAVALTASSVHGLLRFSCSSLVIDRLDPLVNPGMAPSPHLHQIVGGNGFNVTMDVRSSYPYNEIAQAVQANLAQGGIKVDIIPGDNKQTLAKYRARQHDIYIGEWSADYIDPHSNAQGFTWNPDNSDKSSYKMLAWRNSWDIPELTKETNAALAESSTAKRAQLYETMQKQMLAHSPFVIMFEQVSQVATRPGVSGLEVGPINDLVSYLHVNKQ